MQNWNTTFYQESPSYYKCKSVRMKRPVQWVSRFSDTVNMVKHINTNCVSWVLTEREVGLLLIYCNIDSSPLWSNVASALWLLTLPAPRCNDYTTARRCDVHSHSSKWEWELITRISWAGVRFTCSELKFQHLISTRWSWLRISC